MKEKNILIIFILLFVSVVVWTGTSIYRTIVTSTVPETTSQDLAPITPTFDTKTINMLKQRQKINPSFELENPVPSPEPVLLPAQPVQIASVGGTITP